VCLWVNSIKEGWVVWLAGKRMEGQGCAGAVSQCWLGWLLRYWGCWLGSVYHGTWNNVQLKRTRPAHRVRWL
jgi:hypothetical protein